MTIYVTVEDVDLALGDAWAQEAAKPSAVMQANDWLTSRNIPADIDDDRIVRAGAYLAKMAAAGTLYADTRGDVKRKRVKADSVESETEYADGSRAVLGDMAYVTDLLKPWLNPFGSRVRVLSRL
ncbi:hypothetical protein [Halomonas sp. 707B3]|uniref:hypothetical protein n=1 Tax=Halomonas sp. 707B3 TaxID=1681043 RepID=UPI00209E1A06|nr:hypothetical protein [Halomonas sp. 707B3]MCP1316367.1 hypothetical protein [Halomonas sp. 707B3]